MRAMSLAAAVALTLAGCGAAETDKAPAEAAGGLVLTDKPNLSADVAALPRLEGQGATITAINADMDRLDAAAVENATACAEGAGGGAGGGWSRSITRPMTGPAYLTLREHSEWYCGGAYPDTDQTAVTWDLATGQRVDWAAAIPGLNLTVGSLEGMPAGYVAQVSSAALGAWFSARMLATPDAEWVAQCRDVFDPARLAEQTFNIWASAENGGVSVQPEFAHVVQACAETATLTPADLAGFNANPALVEAITAAHAAGHWAPKEDAAPAA